MHLITVRVELKTIYTVDVNVHAELPWWCHWSGKAHSAFYSNHVTTCGPIAASFFCYKLATNMLICCPINDKMVLSVVSACLIADYIQFFYESRLHFTCLFQCHSFPQVWHNLTAWYIPTSLSFACPKNENNQRRTCHMYLHLHQWCTDMEILQSWSNPKLFHKLHIQSISES